MGEVMCLREGFPLSFLHWKPEEQLLFKIIRKVGLTLGMLENKTLRCFGAVWKTFLSRLIREGQGQGHFTLNSEALHYTVSATVHFFVGMWETPGYEGQHAVPPLPHVLYTWTKIIKKAQRQGSILSEGEGVKKKKLVYTGRTP